MTTQAVALAPLSTSDAAFRAWGQDISNALAAIGLVKHTDTGQINWATVTAPAAGANAGYEIWRFNDALQATKPVYIKITYGASSGSGALVTVQVSNGTNGAGTLNGSTTSTAVTTLITNSNVNTYPCFFSSDGSYLNMLLFMGLGASAPLGVFSIDRTRASDGSATNDGLFIYTYTTSGATTPAGVRAQTMNFSTLTVSAQVVGATTGTVGWTMPQFFPTTLVSGSDIGLIPMNVTIPKLMAPSLSTLLYNVNNIATGTVVSVTTHGAQHSYLATGVTNAGGGPTDANAGLALRYE
jgi:hypothetical protein